MPVRFGNSSAVMTTGEVYAHTRAGVNIFPEEEESTSLVLYEVREPFSSSSTQVQVVKLAERRPKKYKKSSKKYDVYEIVSASPRPSRRYEISPPEPQYYLPAPPALILPPPIPQPVVALPYPPPEAPEVPTIERRPRLRSQDVSSIRAEPARTRVYSPLSAGSTVSSSLRSHRSTRDSHRRSSFVSTPATSPARASPRMIEDSSRGPKEWREEIRLKDPVIFRNADGTKTKQYYYR